MKIAFLTLGIAFFLANNAPSQDLSVLVLTGGHDFDRPAFFKMMESLPGIRYSEIAHPEARNYFLEKHHGEFDVLVFYDMIQEISPMEKEGFEKLVRKGIGLVFLHHAIVSYQDWDFYKDMLGGRYVENNGHPAKQSNYKHDVHFYAQIVNERNDILNGISEFKIYDETYDNVWIADTVNPLIATKHSGSMPILAWTQKPFRHTRSVYIQPGHGPEVFSHPMYRKLLAQSIYWASGKSIPQIE